MESSNHWRESFFSSYWGGGGGLTGKSRFMVTFKEKIVLIFTSLVLTGHMQKAVSLTLKE